MINKSRLLAAGVVCLLGIQIAGCGSETNSANGAGVGPTGPGNPGGPQTGTGVATVSWTPPTTNEDGSPVTLSAFNIYVGNAQANLQPVATVSASQLSYTVNNLPRGVSYFAVTAVSSNGMESIFSDVGTKTIN